MRELVRHTATSPIDEDFNSALGTPIVLNTSDGLVYLKKDDGAIVPVGGNIVRAAVAAQGAGFSSDTYITRSGLLIPPTSMVAGMWWRWQIIMTKTAAGTAQPVWQVRIGSNQSTADTSRISITTSAQTAAADSALVTILVTCRTVGASGLLRGAVCIQHVLTTTGFASTSFDLVQTTGAGFDNTALGGQYIGLSVNGGASAAWTTNQVVAQCGIGGE